MKQTLLGWLESFWKVLIIPTPKTFRQEAQKADGKFASALGWLVFFAIGIIVAGSIIQQSMLNFQSMLTAIILLPLAIVFFTTVLNFICQRIFHCKAYIYDKLLYITVAILPAFILYLPFIGLMPADVFAISSFALFSYQVVLLIIAVKTIVQLELWQALVAVTFSIAAGILIGFVIFLLIVSTISPPEIK